MSDMDKKLFVFIQKSKIIIHELIIYSKEIYDTVQYKILMQNAISFAEECMQNIDSKEINFTNMREFLNLYYYKLLNMINTLVVVIKSSSDTNFFSVENWQKKNKMTLFMANYFLLNQNYRRLKDFINEHFIQSYKASYELIIDENSPLWDISDAKYFEFFSDIYKVREISKKILNNIPPINGNFDLMILEEQISEIIKNAVKHGNRSDSGKKVKIWYFSDDKFFKIIVEDEGPGFMNFVHWNEFNRKRNEALKSGNMEEMLKYIQYKGPYSTDEDGGNSLFSALEYWDSGLVYNDKKNKVVAVKYLY